MRKNDWRVVGRVLLCIVFAWLLVSPAWAGTLIGVGQDPPPPPGPFTGDDVNEDMIIVGSPSAPIFITPDPSTTTPWTKDFMINRDGQGWSETGTGSMVNVMEFIAITPSTSTGVPIVDWHEDIDPSVGDGSRFKWADGDIQTPAGTFPGMVSPDGKSIWFDFPPLLPGMPFKINKNLMWIGPPTVVTPGPNGTNNYHIRVHERPSVPEPATLVLSTMAIVGFAVMRRRG